MEFYREEKEKEGRGAELREVLAAGETGVPALAVFGHAAGLRPALPILAHQHRNKFELILVKKGMRRLMASGVAYTLYAGQAFVTSPNEDHASLEEQPSPAEIYWFQLDMASRSGFLGLDAREGGALYRALSGFRGRQLELPPALLQRFADAFVLLGGEGPLDRAEGHALFVCSLCRLLACRAPLELLTPDIDRAKQHILLHVKEAIDLDELLLTSGLSVGEFRQKFQAQIGCTPREYINRRKIERACRTVALTNKSIADIAYEYHFSSASVFKVLFKREMGMSPQKYRRRHKNDRPPEPGP